MGTRFRRGFEPELRVHPGRSACWRLDSSSPTSTYTLLASAPSAMFGYLSKCMPGSCLRLDKRTDKLLEHKKDSRDDISVRDPRSR